MMPNPDQPREVSSQKLLTVSVDAGGTTHFDCRLPKLEAVKMLLNFVEELRAQALQERNRVIQGGNATNSVVGQIAHP